MGKTKSKLREKSENHVKTNIFAVTAAILDPKVKISVKFIVIPATIVRNVLFSKNGFCRNGGHLGSSENTKLAVIRSPSKFRSSVFFFKSFVCSTPVDL